MRGLMVSVLMVGCSASPPPHPSPEPPAPEACVVACERLQELGCPEGDPTPAGASCVEVCRATETSGLVTLRPACVARIQSCEAIEGCVYEIP